jgi:hypothetical protein
MDYTAEEYAEYERKGMEKARKEAEKRQQRWYAGAGWIG